MGEGTTDTPTAPAASRSPLVEHTMHPLPCVRCGYDLRGMRREDVCPECGTTVGVSWGGNPLLAQEPAWLRRVAEGLAWEIAATSFWGLYLLFAPQVGRVPGAFGGASTFPIGLLVLLAGWLLTTWATWLVTTPEPRVVEQGLTLRRAVRLGTFAWVVVSAYQALATYRNDTYFETWFLYVFASWLGLLSNVLWYVYVRRLVWRLPDSGLALPLSVLMITYAVCEATRGPYLLLGVIVWYVGGPELPAFNGELVTQVLVLQYACLALVLFLVRRKVVAGMPPEPQPPS